MKKLLSNIWSNIHYGYVGITAGRSEDALLDGAGPEQIASDVVRRMDYMPSQLCRKPVIKRFHLSTAQVMGMAFDWHSDLITRDTPVDSHYRNTQNVRRFMTGQCGDSFRLDRAFMSWIKDGTPKSMGQVADEWLRIQSPAT